MSEDKEAPPKEDKPVWRHVECASAILENQLNELAAQGYTIKDIHPVSKYIDSFRGSEERFHIIAFDAARVMEKAMGAQMAQYQKLVQGLQPK